MKKKNNKTGISYSKKTTNNSKVKTKVTQTKKNTDNKKSVPKKKIKFKFDVSAIIGLVIGIILLVLISIYLGWIFAIIMVIGIALIILLSNFIKKLRRKKRTRIVINILLILGLLICIAGAGLVALFLYYVVKQAPEFDVNELQRNETTILYTKNNEVFAELGTEKREIITYDEISQVFIDALIATEDSRFFQHNGFDAARFIKASIGQVVSGSEAGGASTISMQVVKNSFTNANVDSGIAGIVRKFTDIYLSIFELEKTYSKQEIIELYVNIHYMGAGAYGVEQASQTYFGKSARELNLAEASLLAGLFQSPSSLDPFKNPDAATERRSTVLRLMVMHGYITEEERKLAESIPVSSLLIPKAVKDNAYQAYIDQVVDEINKRYGVNPYNVPMLIYTNMDTKKQAGMDNIFNSVTYTWKDSVVQAGVAVVDVNNGKIVAISAGRNNDIIDQWNYASGMKKQIGSTAKPIFDYAPGMEYNGWSTYTMFNDTEYFYSSGQPIRNSDREYWGWMTLRKALYMSRNVPALQAFQQVDKDKIIDFVTSLGIKPEIDRYGNIHEAHSIGAFTGSNPLEMAAAYAAFANGGTYYEPYAVHKVVFRNTGEEATYKSEGKQVMSDSTAYMITYSLKSAVEYGLSSGARVEGVNVAAKTGTTNYPEDVIINGGYPTNIVNDAWIVGYDPDYSIGLWYGYPNLDKEYNLPSTEAVTERGRLFRAVGNIVFTKDYQDFKKPSSVVCSDVEWGSNNMLPSENTPEDQQSYECFRAGTEPTEVSTKYDKLKDVTNLSVVYDPTTLSVNLSWSKAKPSQNAKDEYGNFGYKVYKDETYLGFTEDNYFIISDEDDPYATYKIVTTYEDYSEIDSPGIEFTLDDGSKYVIESLVPTTRTYSKDEELDSWDKNPSSSDIKLYRNEEVITDFETSITIKNSNGETIENMTNLENETYTITYIVTYDYNEVASLSRTVVIE